MTIRRTRRHSDERHRVVAILYAIERVKEAIAAFEDGEINLLVAWQRVLLETEGRAEAA